MERRIVAQLLSCMDGKGGLSTVYRQKITEVKILFSLKKDL